jgi:hypothetical protein
MKSWGHNAPFLYLKILHIAGLICAICRILFLCRCIKLRPPGCAICTSTVSSARCRPLSHRSARHLDLQSLQKIYKLFTFCSQFVHNPVTQSLQFVYIRSGRLGRKIIYHRPHKVKHFFSTFCTNFPTPDLCKCKTNICFCAKCRILPVILAILS